MIAEQRLLLAFFVMLDMRLFTLDFTRHQSKLSQLQSKKMCRRSASLFSLGRT